MNRRNFFRHGAAAVGLAAAGSLRPLRAQAGDDGKRELWLVADPHDGIAGSMPVQRALARVSKAADARGFHVRPAARLQELPEEASCVVATNGSSPLLGEAGVSVPSHPEAMVRAGLRSGRRRGLLVAGADVRGLAYALHDLADLFALEDEPWSVALAGLPVRERPANAVRSVMRPFVSSVEDPAWYRDADFWRQYLGLLAAERFNRFNLAFGLGYDAPNRVRDTYLYFAYPFLLDVPGYQVRATGLPDAERDANLAALRFVSDEAAAWGLDFQLGLWTHAYRWTNSPSANFNIAGLSERSHAAYCRAALELLLRECPNISGVTLRIHGESGVPEGSYGFWREVFGACARAGRDMRLDMHAKGMDAPTLETALATGLPVTVSPKFWAEHLGLPYHQAAIRAEELPRRAKGASPYSLQSGGARSFLRYGYGDLLREDRRYRIVHRIWPGTQRVLLSGDPVFAAAYGRAMSFCGSDGCELFDPLSFKGRHGSGRPGGRDGYANSSLRAGSGDYEKFRYTYRLWGRHLYRPDCAREVWQRQLRSDYGAAAEAAERALGQASRVLPLVTTAHLPSAANNNYWPEMYVNMPVVEGGDPAPYSDTPSPKRFGTVSPLDPQLFSGMDEHADALLRGNATAKVSPVAVAQWLEDLSEGALRNLREAMGHSSAPAERRFRRLEIDVRIQAGIGRFFGRKMRAGVLYAGFLRTGDSAMRQAAVAAYREAREAWMTAATAAAGAYVQDVTYGEEWWQHGNWSDRLAAMDRDIDAMAAARPLLTGGAHGPYALNLEPADFIRAALSHPIWPDTSGLLHIPPDNFTPGTPVPLFLAVRLPAAPHSARLLYRHAQQAEPWRSTDMIRTPHGFTAEVPADYANSPYPLLYYFESTTDKSPALFPGLDPTFRHPPYYALRASATTQPRPPYSLASTELARS